jgi:acetyl-CoA carboxylase biotin carboxyl carrier protein
MDEPTAPGRPEWPAASGESAGPAGLAGLAELIRTAGAGRVRLTVNSVCLEFDSPGAAPRAPDVVAEPPGAAPAPAADAQPVAGPSVAGPAGLPVTAPLVGVFYRAEAPGRPPFVDVGQRVEAGQQIAIIEAMKFMNPITTEHAGVVAAVHVDDSEVVEFGEPLVTITPG